MFGVGRNSTPASHSRAPRNNGAEEGSSTDPKGENPAQRSPGFWNTKKGTYAKSGLCLLGAAGGLAAAGVKPTRPADGKRSFINPGGDRTLAHSPLNLNGTVHTANGIPIANAECTLQKLGKTTRTDANGRFNFTGPPDGKLKNGGELLNCTHPDFHGGLGEINTRPIPDYTAGHADTRMFSKDPFWNRMCGNPADIHFNYAQAPDVEAPYKQIMGSDPSRLHGQIASEVCQTMFSSPHHALEMTHLDVNVQPLPARLNGNAEVGKRTAGKYVNLNSDKIKGWDPKDPASRKRLIALQTHEAAHNQQTSGDTAMKGNPGYAEAMADTVMTLNGHRPGSRRGVDLSMGAKCKGDPTAPYAKGAQYLAYIARHHPTFVPEMMEEGKTGSFQERVKRITGREFSEWVDDCRTKGMP